MNRETTTFETPISKDKVEIKTYLTGRERRALTDVYLQSGVDFNAETQDVKGIKPDIINKAQDVAWLNVVVSINGSTENIVDTILDMRSEDFNFVTNKVNEVTADLSFEQKKTI